MQNNVEILISCHKPSDVLNTEVFKPIQVGTALKKDRLPGMLYDNDGENMSEKNPMYCELTAQYWAWKNLDLDYYGFCHYRRYFNFSDTTYKEDAYGNIIESYIDEQTAQKYCLTDETVRNLVSRYDVIITERKDLTAMPDHFTSSKDQYKKASKLHFKDYQTMLDIIDEKYPEYSECAKQFADGHTSCFCNMYILRKDIFFEYCEWMFAVLEEFCNRTKMKYYSTEALRTPGHLSERLFNIYLLKLLKDRPELRVKEVQCVAIQNTDPQEEVLRPNFDGNAIPVVFAANNNFVPMFATCFQSLIVQSTEENNYDVVLIGSDITKENQGILSEMTEDHPNITLRFYDPGRLLQNYHLKANAHISVETYYRFLIQDILPDYDKVLYLDCDMIINADVAELYATDVEGYMLAAAKDPDFLGQINGASAKTKKYCKDTFHMKNPYKYFQAGVLLFNIREMQKAYSLDEWLTFASTPYMYNDQDVLNLYCEGHVKYLDMAWNLITDCDHYRVNNVIVYAPDAVQKEYMAARKAPKIIHYAGGMKPWHRPTEDFARYFWTTARKTAYYEELLYRMTEGVSYWQVYEASKHNMQFPKEKLHLRMLNSMMPLGTNRRERLDDLYSRIFTK